MERSKDGRVTFSRPLKAQMMAIDGTWRRDCEILEISEASTNIHVSGTVEGIGLKEFFLLLSSTGLAYRRCLLSWVHGDQIGASFLKDMKKSRTPDLSPRGKGDS